MIFGIWFMRHKRAKKYSDSSLFTDTPYLADVLFLNFLRASLHFWSISFQSFPFLLPLFLLLNPISESRTLLVSGPYLPGSDYFLFTWLISSQWNVFVKKVKVICKKTNGFMLNSWLIHYFSYKWLKKSMVLKLTVENYIAFTKRQNGNAISLL